MDIADWSDLFVAVAGASAALAGLIIVAMSVNVEVIVANKSMPARAGATIALLVLVTLVSIVGLIPGLAAPTVGLIVLVLTLLALAFAVDSAARLVADGARLAGVKGAMLIAPALAILIGGILLVTGSVDGLYWIVAGMIAAFVVTVFNAWVLLVELRR